ncbi:C40 family peptidase [Luteimonas terricola]|uniref:Lipoprotein n=1 Tax=Luteimonas terricola TaxID=645597 RepID=A0ABQ2EFQ9_9GAMM|nr:C40 family peptidase [Luteimonas terricola]GGK10356.1 lipoprotein [Luteimonas terricola]
MGKATHYPDTGHRAPIALAGLVVVLLAAGCGRDDIRPAPPQAGVVGQREWPQVTPADPAAANSVLMRAISLVGTPYRYGGNTPDGGFDCSGLVNYVYNDMLDLKLPRTSRDLAAYQGPKIEPRKLATADLVFFGSGGNVTHVGIYVGEGRFVHAPSTGGTVRLDHLDGSYWRRNYSGAKRILR